MATACQTISAAITKASSGDVIIIASGLYTESITLGKDLTVIGFGSDSTILSGLDTHRVVLVSGGVRATVYDVAIMHGNSDFGGGIDNQGMLTLTNSLFASNYGSGGGAIRNQGTLVLNDSIISGNVASFGGAIANSGLVMINHSSIQGNQAFDAGGLGNEGTMSINTSSILSNTAEEEGGGIYNSSVLQVDHSIIANNGLCGNHCTFSVARPSQSKAPDNGIYTRGAGVFTQGGVLTIANTTISDNNAPYGDSGGLLNNSQSVISNTTISGNTASYAAGINNNVMLTLTNVTINGNTNDGLRSVGSAWVKNTIIASADCAGPGVISLGHNLDSGNSCGLNATGDLTNTNPLLGPLQDNGGNTLTEALLPGSLAINGGTNSGCPATDQRGIPRPQGGICDIGAYELVFTDTLFLPIIAR